LSFLHFLLFYNFCKSNPKDKNVFITLGSTKKLFLPYPDCLFHSLVLLKTMLKKGHTPFLGMAKIQIKCDKHSIGKELNGPSWRNLTKNKGQTRLVVHV